MTTLHEPTTRDGLTEAIDWPRQLAKHEGWLRGVIFARGQGAGGRRGLAGTRPGGGRAASPAGRPGQGAALALPRGRGAVDPPSAAPGARAQAVDAAGGRVERRGPPTDDPAEWLLREERRRLVRGALALLPGRDAEILLRSEKFGDLNMLVAAGGRERSHEEFVELFAAAGYALKRALPTGTQLHLIEGTCI